MLRTAFYYIPSAMTGFIVSVFPFRNRVSPKEAFEGLELGEGKPSRPVLRGPGGRKAVWLLGNLPYQDSTCTVSALSGVGHAACTAVATGVSVAIVGLLQPASGATFWSTSIGPQVAGSYS